LLQNIIPKNSYNSQKSELDHNSKALE